MYHDRRVKLFRNGRSQAVRIPREFELPGKDAVMRKEGSRLVIEAVSPPSLIVYLQSLPPLDETIGPIEDLIPDPVHI